MNTPTKPCARGLTEATALLTSAGYTVIAPVDPSSVIPAAEVGQVWQIPATATGTYSRVVTILTARTIWFRRVLADGTRGAELGSSLAAWRAWARSSGARPVGGVEAASSPLDTAGVEITRLREEIQQLCHDNDRLMEIAAAELSV